MIDELEALGFGISGVPADVRETVVQTPEPTRGTLESIDSWLTTVGTVFDRGMDIYEAFEGRRRAQDIIRSEQVTTQAPQAAEPIPATTYAKATASAVIQEFKKPLVIGAVLFVIVGIMAIYKPKLLW